MGFHVEAVVDVAHMDLEALVLVGMDMDMVLGALGMASVTLGMASVTLDGVLDMVTLVSHGVAMDSVWVDWDTLVMDMDF